MTNRTRERADALAEEFQGRVIDYEQLSASPAGRGYRDRVERRAALHPDPEEMRAVIGRRRNRPMFLIDIAVPRNIEPAVNELDNVFLYDIDDLDEVVETNLQGPHRSGRAGRGDHSRRSGAHDAAAEDARGRADHRQPAGATGAVARGARSSGCAASWAR